MRSSSTDPHATPEGIQKGEGCRIHPSGKVCSCLRPHGIHEPNNLRLVENAKKTLPERLFYKFQRDGDIAGNPDEVHSGSQMTEVPRKFLRGDALRGTELTALRIV